MLRILTLLSFLIITSVLQGQTGKLIGKVLDENGKGLPNYPVILNLDKSWNNTLNIMESNPNFVLMDGSDFNFEETMAVGSWRIAIT